MNLIGCTSRRRQRRQARDESVHGMAFLAILRAYAWVVSVADESAAILQHACPVRGSTTGWAALSVFVDLQRAAARCEECAALRVLDGSKRDELASRGLTSYWVCHPPRQAVGVFTCKRRVRA